MTPKIPQACIRITILICLFITINDLLTAQEPVNPAIEDDPVNLIAFRIQNNDNIEMDGRLDERAWAQAIPITDFTQQEPMEGGVPSENTEIRVVYDDHALYIGATLYDDPDGILAFQKQRDGYLSTDDRFMFILDTFLDGRTGYFFETNASGVMSDALITGGTSRHGGASHGGGSSRAWDGIWQVKTFILPDGWSLEIQIPFRTLNFNPDLNTWGINFQRTIRRKNEEILWRGHRRNQDLRQPVHAGRLTGLQGMSQGIGLEAVPYAVANWKHVPEESKPTSYPRDIGLDINYNITPGLKAGISVNTDFAEAESDQRRINLTRFPLRFPERRDFFLEGSSVFSFAPSNGAEPYFSRKIGLLEGEQIPISYASRLGGQVGKYELGFIHVNTAQIKSAAVTNKSFAGEDFTVGRVKRGIFEQSTIGAIYTRRSTGSDPTDPMAVAPKDQHTLGTDLYYRTSRLFGDKNFIIQAFAAWNSNPDRDVKRSLSDLTARGIRLNYPNDIWSAHISYREFGDNYKPAVGFVTRNGYRRAEPRIGWRPRPNISWIRRFDFSVQFRHLEDIDTGITEERQWRFKVLGIDLESQDNFDIDLERQFEYLDRTFEISEGIFVGEGQYTNWEWSVMARTARRRIVSGNLEIRRGGFWGGERTQLEVGIDFRPSPGILISADIENNKVDLPEGSFDANLFRIAGEWSVTPLASITGNIQYDDVSRIVGLFMRTRWILNPGNELFLVFTQNWQNLGAGLFDENREFLTLSRGGSVKINYSYRF
jgi:hypothetical protein